jgi:dolichol-phosphate mannosyltransferase
MPDVTVVIPAYRQREDVHSLLASLEQALDGRDWETIVVVDDAPEGTSASVRGQAQQDRRVRCIERIGRRGLASACLEGMLASSAPYVAVIETGLPFDGRLLGQMLDAIQQGDEDIAVASRYVEQDRTSDLAPASVRVSRVASLLGQALGGGLSDPMTRLFIVRRRYVEKTARRLYGRGFKILLDLIAAAPDHVRIRELPGGPKDSSAGEGRFSTRLLAESYMLVLYHLFGRLVPGRFFIFGAVGLIGVGVHLAVLWSTYAAWGASFVLSQSLAAWAAVTVTFFVNNAVTYGDQSLRGRHLWKGLFSFYAACGIGAIINVAIADWLYLMSVRYWLAGFAGAGIAIMWNFLTTATVTWDGSDQGNAAGRARK